MDPRKALWREFWNEFVRKPAERAALKRAAEAAEYTASVFDGLKDATTEGIGALQRLADALPDCRDARPLK